MNWIISLLLTTYTTSLFAAGPATIATSDRALWPAPIHSPAEFDRASRAEILGFAKELSAVAGQNEDALKAQFHIKTANIASVTRVKKTLMSNLLENWKNASLTCVDSDILCAKIYTEQQLIESADLLLNALPDKYRAWHANSINFHKKYAGELVRLAALFPTVTSEIDQFSSIEHNGFELPDRQFLLTFDDGPTMSNGSTDKLLSLLTKTDLHATFYMLGENLAARLKTTNNSALEKAFRGQCVALHGWQHKSHAKWDAWEKSVLDVQALVKATFPTEYRPWFRPPYGQRLPDSEGFFTKNTLQVALWNIDSQDWNNHLNGSEAGQRVFTLMLLWRHGVILFHDVHPKALEAVPWLMEHTVQTGVNWKDCRSY